MSTPTYKGPGQPTPAATDGLTGWLGGLLAGAAAPAYKTTPPAMPVPPPLPPPCPPAPLCPPCKPCPELALIAARTSQSDEACDAVPIAVDEHGNAVIPVGPGPITIVINPRS